MPSANSDDRGRSSYPIDLDKAVMDFVAQGGLAQFAYPKVAVELGKILFRFDFLLGVLAPVVEKDPGLSAAVMSRANSAFLSRGNPCTTVKAAVIRIGAKQLGWLVAASRFGSHLVIDGPLLALRRVAWREGLISALVCDALADLRKTPGQEAYSCGLQHDLGRTLTLGCLELVLKGNADAPAREESFWWGVADRLHVQVGSKVAALWGLPALVKETIEHHHDASFAGMKRADVLQLVASADSVNAYLATCSDAREDALTRIGELRDADERAAVARTLATLPGYLADLSTGQLPPDKGPRERSLVVADIDCGAEARTSRLPLCCRQDGKTLAFEAVLVSRDRLLITGAQPLTERFLTSVSTVHAPDARFWAEVMWCCPSNGGFHVQLRPFALSAAQLSVWRSLSS